LTKKWQMRLLLASEFCDPSESGRCGARGAPTWFAVFPMRIQDECLTRFRKVLRREASGSNELHWFRGGTGSYRVIRSLDVIGPVFQPEQASRGNPSPSGDK
jgi:hypothetical protein